MPYKSKRPCAVHGCPNLTDSYYCPDHAKTEAKQYNRHRRDPATNKRYGAAWRRARERYVKAHPLCEECLKRGRYVAAQEVHHVKPLADGGTHNDGNLLSLCKSCHSSITMTANNDKASRR